MKSEQPMAATEVLTWYKSSYSSDTGGNCVEVAVEWRKSSYSDYEDANCVEVTACPCTVHVRDSKDTAKPSLAFGRESWADFVAFAVADRTVTAG